MATNSVSGFRLLACTFGEDFVLQTALGHDDTVFLGILSKELRTFLLGCLSSLSLGSILLLLQFAEESINNLLTFLMAHLEVVVLEHIGDRCRKIIDDEFSFESHLLELLTDAETKRITEFIHNSS